MNELNILLVEDDEDDFFLFKEELNALEDWSSVIDWVSNYDDALEKMLSSNYDIHFLDFNLGVHNGLDLIKDIRVKKLSGPVIMITGQYDKGLDYRAMYAGVDDFLIKGNFDSHKLGRTIRYAIERKRVDKEKDEFISVISHELRTPLTSIKGSLNLISMGTTGFVSEGTQKMVNISERNCDRLIKIVNDLLDAQKITANKLTLELVRLNLRRIVSTAIEAHMGYAKLHDITLKFMPSVEKDVNIHGDEGRLLQIMANLLSNATKFSRRGGEVLIKIENLDSGLVRVNVIDYGPGIPEEFRETIFSKFTQADSSTTRNYPGTGLGLNIARSLVELHGGQIGFESVIGEGTTFFFDLPLAG